MAPESWSKQISPLPETVPSPIIYVSSIMSCPSDAEDCLGHLSLLLFPALAITPRSP